MYVDPKNPDFQLIHLDMKEQYGIACKFIFEKGKPNNFQISYIKCISYNHFIGEIEYKVLIKNKTKKVNHKDYYFKLDIELT
jgi:hypothetical protein